MTGNQKKLLLTINDCIVAPIATSAAFSLNQVKLPGEDSYIKLLALPVMLVAASSLVELGKHPDMYLKGIIAKTCMFICLSFSLGWVMQHLLSEPNYHPGTVSLAIVMFGILRFMTHGGIRFCENLPGFTKRIVILGSGTLAYHLGALIKKSNHSFVLAGYIPCQNEKDQVPLELLLNSELSLMALTQKQKTDKILVCLNERRGVFPWHEVMECKLQGIEIMDAVSFYENMAQKLLLESITPSSFIYSDGFRSSQKKHIAKRIFDVAFATLGSALCMPLFPIIAVAIKLDSPGPVFFKQERVGKGEKLFTLYKFRTMRNDAETQTGAVWAQKHDTRITRMGNFLRRTRIDEIPQLFNVMRGDMSLVGPRPERQEFVKKLKEIIPYYSERHLTKPGITGWAQVRYQYGASAEDAIEKLRYDLFYIKHRSLYFDLVILIETIGVVIFRRGSR